MAHGEFRLFQAHNLKRDAKTEIDCKKNQKDLRDLTDARIRSAFRRPLSPLCPLSPYASSGTSSGRRGAFGATKMQYLCQKETHGIRLYQRISRFLINNLKHRHSGFFAAVDLHRRMALDKAKKTGIQIQPATMNTHLPFLKNTDYVGCSSHAASEDRFRSFRGLAHPSIYALFLPRKTGMTRCFWVFELN